MKRRNFLAVAGAAATGLGGGLAAPALAHGGKRLTMVTTWPRNLPGIGTAAERIADNIREATEGAIDIEVHAAGELLPPFESFDAVSSGRADIYNAAEFYWQEKSKAYALFTSIPFGMTAPELTAWIRHGGGQELWDELAAGFNLKPLLSGNSGAQAGGWFKEELRGPEDVRGLRIRMPGLGGDVFARLGARVETLPAGELLAALQDGRLDAVDWAGPWNDLALGFHAAAKYYYWPGFQEPTAGLCTVFNLDVWNRLTPGQQRIVGEVCAAENDFLYTSVLYNNAFALDALVNRHGVLLRAYPDALMRAFREETEAVMEEISSADAFTARVHASYRDSLRATSASLRDTELAYLNRR